MNIDILMNSKIVTLLKETPTQVFSCESYEIVKNTFFTEHLRTTAENCRFSHIY